MKQSKLFEGAEEQHALPTPPERGGGKPRLRVAVRDQIIVRALALDQMLPEDDEARLVWDFVCQADLSPLHAAIQAVEGAAGRNANDPRVLLALWLYATIKGVGSARESARLCRRHLAYQWICGLKSELMSDPAAESRRQAAARERATREREQRVSAA